MSAFRVRQPHSPPFTQTSSSPTAMPTRFDRNDEAAQGIRPGPLRSDLARVA